MTTANLLIELGTEELPPKSLRRLAEALRDNFGAELAKAELAHDGLAWRASPRRLALLIKALASSQADKVVEKRGPAVAGAFTADGQPTPAAEGWARSNGISVAEAQRLKTDKGEWLVHHATVRGRSVAELVPEMLASALAKLPIAKPMRWGSSDAEFIRPVHTLTLVYGSELLPGSVLGLSSDRIIRGHRFHCLQPLTLDHADHYDQLLEQQGKVIADFERRKAMIRTQVEAAARMESGMVTIDEDLLEEVTALVEWPVTLVGSFEERFLAVPPEPLISTMKDNQRYFPLTDNHGKLRNRFIFVTNIDSADPSQVISGNEKVVRPRLTDAEFFFLTDRKQPLAARLDSLDTVTFQQQLGSLGDKTRRISALASHIATQLGADSAAAARAGLLAKADLMSNMVMEFPDTQGTMGMHYARLDGEGEAVATALFEQYLPRFAGDRLPASPIGAAVAIADKLDTLVGIFGIGQAPKGDKDPFALRRAALGVLRIMVELKLPLDLAELAGVAAQGYSNRLTDASAVEQVVEFLLGRFRAWYQDEGMAVDAIQAVLARRPTRPLDFDRRVRAISSFRERSEAAALAAANKRVGNLLDRAGSAIAEQIDDSLLADGAETALHTALIAAQAEVAPLFASGDYSAAMARLAALRPEVDRFFDEVMVMVEDGNVRTNRLALLKALRQLFLEVADISLLQA
ncbi:MAG: glycine--tRNA ligase subunit beta [Gammaproteobacteria bacterium]|nr:glycine--tRNA ligase subunit beta [Gammaproteobacteria bacterium]